MGFRVFLRISQDFAGFCGILRIYLKFTVPRPHEISEALQNLKFKLVLGTEVASALSLVDFWRSPHGLLFCYNCICSFYLWCGK